MDAPIPPHHYLLNQEKNLQISWLNLIDGWTHLGATLRAPNGESLKRASTLATAHKNKHFP